jgi:hypothetical protein
MFHQKFIQAAEVSDKVSLDKAQLKDYNEDLMLMKRIKSNAVFLPQLNQEVLHKEATTP